MAETDTIAPFGPIQSRKAGVDIGRCFNDAFDVYGKNLPVLVFAAFLLFVLTIIPPLILAGPLWGGICLMTLDAMTRDDKRIDLGKIFSGFSRFWGLFSLFFLAIIPILLGTILFVLPGIALMTIWMFPTYIMMDKGVGPLTALRMSYRVVMRRGFWPNFLLALLLVVIAVGPELIPYLGAVISLFVTPITWLMNTSAYIQEVREDATVSQSEGDAAKCGACGYLMRGVTTFSCPECGTDLREAGMIPTRL